MTGIKGKKIVLGITGGIAAYKTPMLVRHLIKAGADVKIVLSSAAASFVSPLALSTVSKNEVITDFYTSNNTWNNHVELALWADVIVFAPLTANTLSKFAHGSCDEFIHALYLSAKCPVFFAPAMDLDMYKHPTTTENIERLKVFGNFEIEAQEGELASGLIGKGRMAEPEDICKIIDHFFKEEKQLKNKNILITAGPTHEAIDPVRFIGNHSSGKMGFDIANQAAKMGANVTLITGPTQLNISNPNIKIIRIKTALEMLDACENHFDKSDIFIAAAAVADYRVKDIAKQKIKKKEANLSIELIKNPDILASLSKNKRENQCVVGFALETENELENAKKKLKRKNLDLIVLNSLNDKGAGFKSLTNKVTFITNDSISPQPLESKEKVAKNLLNKIIAIL